MPSADTARRGSRLAVWGLLLVAAALVVAGLVVWSDGAREPVATPAGSTGSTGSTGTAGAVGSAGTTVPAPPAAVPAAARDARRPGAPVRVVVPSLGVDAEVDAVALRGTTLTPPSDPRRLGWWAGSAAAGAPRGATVLAGHTVHDGGGALDDLETVRRGGTVVVGTAQGRTRYVVASVEVLSKGVLARRAPRLFDTAGRPRLVLITCEDWDGTRYRSNVVVIATPRPRGGA